MTDPQRQPEQSICQEWREEKVCNASKKCKMWKQGCPEEANSWENEGCWQPMTQNYALSAPKPQLYQHRKPEQENSQL